MNTYQLNIQRYNPEDDKTPFMQTYHVNKSEVMGIMLLDLLKAVKIQDATLSFRHSCAAGVCGSDGMNINGKNGLACVTKLVELDKVINLRPLPGMPIIRDLVVDLNMFYTQYQSIKPYLQPGKTQSNQEILQTPKQRDKLDGLYECILCACCSTACPSWWWNPDKFVGPAGLLWACRFILDSRDLATEERLKDLEGLYRLFRCRGIMNCATSCPKGLNPAKAIADIRQQVIKNQLGLVSKQKIANKGCHE
ncbi:MAG: succinate dehydrogenase iron-sulfur subunit [Pseudomonadota bacterium]|nr:succinate dehydrogenase iron-sulfur subunit [Pseudomonadota bacterium]